ncbi:MAG TPA: hypothetical protein DHV70_03185 [Firmicutes bacterium]|nr:hypothetical protein [Bacillota bacterium]
MSNKEEFKLFVKSHPELIRYVKNGEMTWQKFYETYSLYGKENDVWNKYFNNNEEIKENINEKKENVSITDVIDMVKKVDLNSVQKNITNISKALGIVQSLITKDEVNTTESYTPRPLYKKFED